MAKKSIPTTEEFLVDFPPHIVEITQKLRTLIKSVVPNSIEGVRLGWRLIGYRTPNAYFGYIAPYSTHVALGFEWGVLMNDPDKRLEGSGKQVRVITIKSLDAIEPEAFSPMLIDSVQVAEMPRAYKLQLLRDRLL